MQGHALDAEFLQELVGHRQQFDIGLRFSRTDDFRIDLVKLPVAALLRALVTEQRAVRRDLERRVLLPAVGQVSARDPGGEFGAQRQRIAAAVFERIHFLRHHIGGLADSAAEYFGFLEYRHFHTAKAVQLAHALEGFDNKGEGFGFGSEDILRAANGLGRFRHGGGD